MCFCRQPNRNGQPGFGERGGVCPSNPPARGLDDVLIFDEPGRCKPIVNGAGNTDYHSHHFSVVVAFGQYALLVRHGGGDERMPLGGAHTRIGELLQLVDSDARYLLLYAIYRAYKDAQQAATQRTAARYQEAFIDGRLKKRKIRGSDRVKVWIAPSSTVMCGANHE